MKIIACHNFYQQPGGEDRVFEDEVRLLAARGHRVVRHTVHNDTVEDRSRLRLAIGTLWSRSAARALEAVVRRERPDIVHFHNTLPLLSPSCYYAARAEGAAVVQTLHNYRLLCPGATLMRADRVCELCVGAHPWAAVRHACYRESRPASAAVAAMLALHRGLGTYAHAVDAYIALSRFSRSKFVSGGLPVDKISVKANFVDPDPGPGTGHGRFALFVGRLAADKGIESLLAAWTGHEVPLPLKIVGGGPLARRVGEAAASHPTIEWLQRQADGRVQELMAAATLLVLPSINYEGCPKTILEALSHGTPILASRLGVMTEFVREGRTGRHFPPGNAAIMARVAREMVQDEVGLRRMRLAARAEFLRRYTAEANYRRLMDIYARAMAQRTGSERGREAIGLTHTPAEIPAEDPLSA